VDEKAKVNASYYVTKRLPNLIKDCTHFLSDNFIFQQDGAPADTAALAQDWIEKKCPGLLEKRMATEFARSQSIGLSRVGRDAGCYQKYTPKPINVAETEDCLAIDME